MFQSTHPRRVRLQGRLPGLQRLDCFNPRTHAGCDNIAEWTQKVHATFQSTHPRRVRPSLRRALPLRPWRFNPRTHAGCDLRVSRFFMPSRVFQSTHPRRVRRSAAAIPCSICCFNPRTHAGCDISGVVPESLAQFQSTHPRRVRRLLGGRQVRVHRVSIHAPTQGATSSTCGSHRSESSFNPRTHAGCDSAVRPVFRVGDVVSIHAPTQGATLRR